MVGGPAFGRTWVWKGTVEPSDIFNAHRERTTRPGYAGSTSAATACFMEASCSATCFVAQSFVSNLFSFIAFSMASVSRYSRAAAAGGAKLWSACQEMRWLGTPAR